MSDVIFVRTRHVYGSYVDLWKLVELSGYPCIYADEIQAHDKQGVTFIISPCNGEWNTWPQGYVKGRLILLQLEWNWDGEHNTPACVDEVWNADKWHAEKNGFHYVPLGSDCRLNEAHPSVFYGHKVYDVALMMYRDPLRRARVIGNLKAEGLHIAPDGWGIDRSVAMVESRILVHIHQLDNMPTIAPLRWCLAAAHHLPIISESVADRGIFGYTHMMTSDYAHLAEFTAHMLKDQRTLDDQAEALHNLLCREYTFKRMVQLHV